MSTYRSSRSPAKGRATGSSTKSQTVDLTLSDSEDDGPVVASRSKVSASKPSTSKAAATSRSKNTSSTSSSKTNGSTAVKRKAKPETDSEDEEDVKPAKKRVAATGGRASTTTSAARKKKKTIESDSDDDDDQDDYKDDGQEDNDDDDDGSDDYEDYDEEFTAKKKAAPAARGKQPATGSAKPPPAPKKTASVPAASKGKAKAKVEDDEAHMEEDDAKEAKKPAGKPAWRPKAPSAPVNPGGKPIPEGSPDCLGGLTIVFSGELETLGREEATSLAKRYGAKVTTSVSSKTSYVVLGSDAGPKKMEMIKKNKIKTLDEDGFLNLIGSRSTKDQDEKYIEQQKKEAAKIKEAAKAIKVDPNLHRDSLWTVKYAPQTLKELCGNPGAVEKLRKWLEAWPKNLKSGFKKPGPDLNGNFRAVLISGPPGIGKTTTAHLVAKLAGYKPIEMNASDTRSKKLLEDQLRSTVDNTVLDGYFQGTKPNPDELTERSCLIMDEVDGTSAGDRGGIGALNALIKKTKIPIICIANDKSSQKMKPLLHTTYQLPFRRPDANMIRARLMTIAYKEGIKIDKTVSDQLVQGTQSDIRQIINILSTWKLGSDSLTYDETKKLTDTRDANALATPFSLMDKLFAPQAWSATSKAKISDKLEVYFQEFDLMPLFVQENYLKHNYARVQQSYNSKPGWKKMELTSKAADAISDGDLVDRMIHGTQQHWSLMPLHGMISTVTPSYHCYGSTSMGGWGNKSGDGLGNGRAFPGWFGKNSTQGRLQRALTDIQIRMRLKVSGDRREIRQSYIPTLFYKLVAPLVDQGADAIDDIIQEMDEYYLTKEEWDAMVELGVDENSAEPLLKKVKPATKTAFTRKYNTGDHPIPFHKGTDIAAAKKVKADVEKPDLEEAFEVEAEPEVEEDEKPKAKKGEENVIKDKLVKAKKPKAVTASAKAKAAKK